MLDGKPLDYAGVMRLEKMPTKLELIATIARLIKQARVFCHELCVVVSDSSYCHPPISARHA